MKFTVVSHACLYIEHKDIKLLIDPWIIGSCYWRSWWNYPEVSEKLINNINPTHIYITHLHWDHYHGPSLRKFQETNPVVLLPKHFNNRMKNDLIKDFKFTNIKELDHGKRYKLREDFKLSSYQFNPFIIDSSLVIEANGITLLNSNDSKTFGLSLKQIINNHPKIDFSFRSHSSAAPIPHCIKNINIDETDKTPSDYADDFIAFAKATKSKYSIPFASSHVYLHELSKKFNKYYSDPSFIKKRFDSKIKTKQKCKIMVSSSSWSKSNGFNTKFHDFSNLQSDIASYAIKNREKLTRHFDLDKKQKLNQQAFNIYYAKFLKACSFPVKVLNFKFGFLILENKSNSIFLCIIDGIKKKTEIISLSSKDQIYQYKLSFIIETPVYVFNDCNIKRMHNTYTASKLLEINILEKNGEKKLNHYLRIVDLYENDCLPFTRLISIKNLIIMLRRWREFLDILYYFFIVKIQKKKIHNLWHTF